MSTRSGGDEVPQRFQKFVYQPILTSSSGTHIGAVYRILIVHVTKLKIRETLSSSYSGSNVSNPQIFSVHFVPTLPAERWHLKELDTFSKNGVT